MATKRLRGPVRWSGLRHGVAVLVVAGVATACQPSAPAEADIHMALSVSPDPPTLAPADVTVQLTDAQGQPLDGADVHLEGDMDMGGMQPVLSETEATGRGQYVAKGVNFGMAGDWVVTVAVSLPSGEQANQKFDLSVGEN